MRARHFVSTSPTGRAFIGTIYSTNIILSTGEKELDFNCLLVHHVKHLASNTPSERKMQNFFAFYLSVVAEGKNKILLVHWATAVMRSILLSSLISGKRYESFLFYSHNMVQNNYLFYREREEEKIGCSLGMWCETSHF